MKHTIKVFIVFMAAILMSCNSENGFLTEKDKKYRYGDYKAYIRNSSIDKKVEVTVKLTKSDGDKYTKVYQLNPGEERYAGDWGKVEIVGEVIINE